MTIDPKTGQFLRADPRTYLYERFAIDDATGCWNWTAGCFPAGYGYFKCKALGNAMAASRASWIIHRGPVTSREFICHKCDNPKCVNPDHLFVGTPKDNVHDMCAKGRISHGEGRPAAKLTDEAVMAMRALRREGVYYRDIASEFGVSKSVAYRAVIGENWSHVPCA